jgi:small subunit ribosomal protein S2
LPEPVAASVVDSLAGEAASSEDVGFEAALGGGVRKAPAAVAALDEDEAAEGGL